MTTTEPEAAAAVSAPPALADLAVEHWRELVGIAALLLRDRSQAEDVVQDAVVACLRGRPSLRSADAGLAYLRSAVLNRARSGLRRRAMVRQHDRQPVVHAPGADETVLAGLARELHAWVGTPPQAPTAGRLQDLAAAADRRRRRTAVAAGLAVAVAAGVGVPLAVTHSHPAARAVLAAEPDRTAAYFEITRTDTQDGVTHHVELYEGHDRGSVFIPDTGQLAVTDLIPPNLPANAGFSWDELWALPRTAAGLEAYYDAHPYSDGSRALGLFAFASYLTTTAGPTELHQAALQVLDSLVGQDGITGVDGTDTLDRPARVFSMHFHPDQALSWWYVDPATGAMLEQTGGAGDSAYGDVVDATAYVDTAPTTAAGFREAPTAPAG